MKKLGWLVFALVSLVLLCLSIKDTFLLRYIGYDQIPEPFVILDERTNLWHGLSLLKTGVPAAWSNLEIYKNGTGGDLVGLNLNASPGYFPSLFNFSSYPKPIWVLSPLDLGVVRGSKHTPFVQPYLDHPPFGALVLAMFVTEPVQSFKDLTVAEFRRGSIYLGIASEILIFLLGWQISRKPWVGLGAALIYGTAPSFLFLSRYALLENVLNPLTMIVLNLLTLVVYPFKHFSSRTVLTVLLLAGIVAGLCALTKVVGWFVVLSGVLILQQYKFTLRQILTFAIPAVVLGSLYFFWGLYMDAPLFAQLFLYQGIQREFIGSLNLITAISKVSILNFPTDGFWTGAFLTPFLIGFKKEYKIIFISLSAFALSIFVLGSANYPWYYLPLVPLLCVTTALFFYQVIISPCFSNLMIFFLLFFSSSFYWGYGVFQADKASTHYQQPFTLYRVFLLIFLLAAIFPIIGDRFPLLRRVDSRKLWIVFAVICMILLYKWNVQGTYFILSHWGKYPSLFTPGTF